MKTVLTLSKSEMRDLLRTIVPEKFMSDGATVTNIEARGYPIREFEITIDLEKKIESKLQEEMEKEKP